VPDRGVETPSAVDGRRAVSSRKEQHRGLVAGYVHDLHGPQAGLDHSSRAHRSSLRPAPSHRLIDPQSLRPRGTLACPPAGRSGEHNRGSSPASRRNAAGAWRQKRGWPVPNSGAVDPRPGRLGGSPLQLHRSDFDLRPPACTCGLGWNGDQPVASTSRRSGLSIARSSARVGPLTAGRQPERNMCATGSRSKERRQPPPFKVARSVPVSSRVRCPRVPPRIRVAHRPWRPRGSPGHHDASRPFRFEVWWHRSPARKDCQPTRARHDQAQLGNHLRIDHWSRASLPAIWRACPNPSSFDVAATFGSIWS
jgi:hypothetical protein